MKVGELYEDGRIVKGVNTTVDVGTNEIPKQARKFGFKVDKDGRPPTLSKKVKGKSTNVLYNLGLTEHGINNKKKSKKKFDYKQPRYKIKNLDDLLDKGYLPGTLGSSLNRYKLDRDYHRRGITASKDFKQKQQVTEAIQVWPLIVAAFTLLAKKKGAKKAKEIMTEFLRRMPPGVSPEVVVDFLRYLLGGSAGGYFAHQISKNRKKEKEEVKENVNAQSEIYVDMDGVLADFFGDWKKLVGKDWRNITDIKPALQKIRDTEDFWLNLPVTSNAKNLLSLIKDIKGSYKILSSPLPDDPNSEPHKRQWIEKHLSFFPPKDVIITFDKAKYASQPDGTPNILIDDYGVNIGKWEAAGGMGFKHKDHKFERTARNLKTLMKEDMSKKDIKKAHKKADKMLDSPKAKKSIGKWAKEKGIDPKGAVYAIAMNQQKRESYTRDQLPQIKNKNLQNIKHTIEKVQVKDLIPVQEERIMENFKRQVDRLTAGKYNHIVVDCDNKIINGHHRLDALKMLNIKEVEVARLPWKIKAIVEANMKSGRKK